MADPIDPAALADARRLAASGAARRVRLASNVSIAEVADAIGCSKSSVLRWETGRMRPHGAHALAYGQLIRRLMEAGA